MKRLLLLVSVPFVTAWLQPKASAGLRTTSTLLKSSQAENADTSVYEPVFDFSKPETVDMIGRLDDAIMGGISTSSVVVANDTESNNFAKWFGVCRTDGGGFCGFRTNPFREPLQVADADGFYLVGRLVSDLEPERRVWKFSTRTEPGRGEKVYQASFSFPKNQTSWHRVIIPFAEFRLVQGPRVVPNGPPLNATGGIYQVGMTMSKFVFGSNATELANFRDGFFEVQFKEIGFYKQQSSSQKLVVGSPQIMSESESKKQQPLLFKLIAPVFRLLFSEASRRRKSAMKLLRERRGLSRGQAILFGLRYRAKSVGSVRSFIKTLSILATDSLRSLPAVAIRIVLYPLSLVRKATRALRRENRSQPPN